jgi:hypothetical protein
VHLLPVATSVGVASVIGTKLAVRFGTKLIVTTGLVMVAGFYAWVTSASATTGYGTIAAQMVLYGIGMGLTSAPATEAIMGAVPRQKAGVGSAVNDATRLLGGTLGVAVIGSVYASLYASRLTATLPGNLPHSLAHAAHSSVGAAFGVAQNLAEGGGVAIAGAVQHAATGAFLHGFSAGCVVAGGVAAAGAVMAAVLLPAQPLADPSDEHSRAEAQAGAPDRALAVPREGRLAASALSAGD